MTRIVLLAAAPLAAVLVVVLVVIPDTSTTMLPLLQFQQTATACQPTSSAGNPSPSGTPEQQAAALSPDQRALAARIIDRGRQRGLPPRAWQIALQAAKTESNLTNPTGGDRDSIGVFQMRPSMGWGTPQQLRNIDYQIATFYDRLVQIPDWQTQNPGDVAQAVERSAYPERYKTWAPLAVHLISTHTGMPIQAASGCSSMPPPSDAVRRVLDYAHAQLGKPYVWGAAGPEAFDCSGLTMRAWQQAGIAIPKYSRDQYTAGIQLPLQQAQPGDLVFWGTDQQPGGIYHVALMLDPATRTVLHAPQPGETVETTRIWERDLLPTVVRPDARPA
ncbi:C40 family peptidase [Saccharopolyspora griseoalba]|uniref:C40 family peptidase n=1 Tax=Saccharopolyspora griseoalba TaxID=1431848 RepID=A0ABW2LTT1_9PSEU